MAFISSMLMLVAFVYMFCRAVAFAIKPLEKNYARKFIPLFFISSLFITAFSLLFTRFGTGECSLYFIPCLALIFPMIGLLLDKGKQVNRKTLLARITAIIVMVALISNGAVTAKFLLERQERRGIKYDGLAFKNISITDELKNAVEFAKDNGFDIGFATFWNANVVTEMTNGRIKMVPFTKREPLKLYEWLTFKEYGETNYYVGKNVFLLLSLNERAALARSSNIEPLYEDEHYAIYPADVRDEALHSCLDIDL